jgi:hypothetical protein
MGGLRQKTKKRRRSRPRGLQKQTRKIKDKLHVAGRLSRLEQRHRIRPRLARPLARSRRFVPAAGLQPRRRSGIRMTSRQLPCKLIVPPLELPHGRALSPPKIEHSGSSPSRCGSAAFSGSRCRGRDKPERERAIRTEWPAH